MSKQEEKNAPGFTVTVSGQESTHKEPNGLIHVLVEDHIDMIGIAQFCFAKKGSMEWNKYKIGDDVEVETVGSERKIFVGVITGFRHVANESGETLTIQAMDPLVKLGSSRFTKVYEEQKDSDVVSSVLSEASVDQGTIDATDETHKYILQRNESHLTFLRRLAARNGYRLTSNEGKIDFVKVQYSESPIEFERTDVGMLDYHFTDQRIPSKLTVYGWNYVKKEMVEGSASSSDIDTIGSGDNAVDKTGQIWQKESWISDVQVASQDGAKAMAVGELNRLARGFLRGRARVAGNSEIHAGVKIKIVGHVAGFNPEGFVVSSRHTIDSAKGTQTEFQFCGNTYPTD